MKKPDLINDPTLIKDSTSITDSASIKNSTSSNGSSVIATCCDEAHLLPVADAIAHMLAQVAPTTESESVSLCDALDRILARPLIADINVPTNDNSAMDGYALRSQDAHHKKFRVLGSALAGHAFEGEITPGTCVRITTGAMIPPGADCVVMQENTDVIQTDDDLFISLTQIPRVQENIRQRGEDIAQGDIVLAQGKRLGPLDIALLASLGTAQVAVFRRLRIAVLSTGDELIPPGNPLPSGHIYDSNRYGIIALLQRLAVEVLDVGLIPDQPDALRAAFKHAGEIADAVISSGGVSVGDADFVKDILDEQGAINFWKVAIKPGKPFAFGKLGASYFFGLPGNPVSAMVTLHQLALPILRHMAGEPIMPPATLQIPLTTGLKKRPGRTDYQRGHLSSSNQQNQVNGNGPQGSGVLTSFSGANCYIVLEQERGSVAAGELVQVLPFDRFIE